MLRLILTCLALCFSYNIAWAKYCVKLPSCEELGYVFPYKDGRRQIRCHFDTDKALYLDYCQAYGIQGKPDEVAGEYQECIEEKADGTKINTGYYRYTRCNVGYRYESGHCVKYLCSTPHTCLVGNIYLHNNEPIGVVFFDDGSVTKILALKDINVSGEEVNTPTHVKWLEKQTNECINNIISTNIYREAKQDMNGKVNTNVILSYASSKGITAPAAMATKTYAPTICSSGSFCGKGEWYLPALGELYTILVNLNIIEKALDSTGGAKLKDTPFYWSSTQYDCATIWEMKFPQETTGRGEMQLHSYVRPVLAF